MIEKAIKLPFFAKASLFFIGLYAFISMLYIAQGIIIPLIFSIIIATVLHPVVNFFVKHKFNRILAIIITLLLTFLFIASIGTLLYSQVARFSESWPKLVDKFTVVIDQSTTWASGYLDISPKKISTWLTNTKFELLNTSTSSIGQTLMNLGSGLVILFLMPVYIFMILFYQPLLTEFFRRLFSAQNRIQVDEVIKQIRTVFQSYLVGLVIEAVIVSVLNAAGLLILGIDYAIMLGIIGGILNVIPYLGGLIAVALPMMIALVTKDTPMYALYVMTVYYFVQIIDNNYIVPKIVASKVKINALISIIVVLAFGVLWGIPGMFLSIPLTAILKVIFDHIESLKPWGFLLGDTMPPIVKLNFKIIKKLKI